MSFKSYRKESRINYGTSDPGALTTDQLNTGAVLRIADACELMAKNHAQLIDEVESCKRSRDLYRRWYEKAERRISAGKGQITKLKKRIAELEEQQPK